MGYWITAGGRTNSNRHWIPSTGTTQTTSVAPIQQTQSITIQETVSSIQTETVAATTTSTVYYTTEQMFTLSCSGLRPFTQHFFTFNNSDVSAACQPNGGALGDPLITDTSGTLTFYFYYNSGIAANTSVASEQSLINMIVGNKVGVLSSSDGLSTANITINISA